MVLFTTGCGGPVGPTTGVVHFEDGTPVKSGSVELRRLSDKERFSSRIAPDGTFRPADKDSNVGLPPGNYDAVVVQIVLTEDLAAEDHTHGRTVPRRYADYYTSDLKVQVNPDQVAPVMIVIKSDESLNP